MQMYTKVRYAATVGELREALKDIPAETIVIQSRDTDDSEGNKFLPLMGVEKGVYSPENELVLATEDADALSDPCPVVCLWPAHGWQHAQTTAAARQISVKSK